MGRKITMAEAVDILKSEESRRNLRDAIDAEIGRLDVWIGRWDDFIWMLDQRPVSECSHLLHIREVAENELARLKKRMRELLKDKCAWQPVMTVNPAERE